MVVDARSGIVSSLHCPEWLYTDLQGAEQIFDWSELAVKEKKKKSFITSSDKT